MSNAKKITQDELINLVFDKMLGASISKPVIEIIIKAYNEAKVDQLLKGFSYEEIGIGVVSPAWRKVSKAFSPKDPFTPKLTINLDSSLKSSLVELLKSSPEFREAVGAQEL